MYKILEDGTKARLLLMCSYLKENAILDTCKNANHCWLARHMRLRQFSVIESVGCGKFGINQTMAWLFQRGEWVGLVTVFAEAGLRMM